MHNIIIGTAVKSSITVNMLFRKMHSNDLECSYGCHANKDQRHLFQECSMLGSKDREGIYYFIFKDKGKQKQAAIKCIQIERRRKEINSAEVSLNYNFLTGGT